MVSTSRAVPSVSTTRSRELSAPAAVTVGDAEEDVVETVEDADAGRSVEDVVETAEDVVEDAVGTVEGAEEDVVEETADGRRVADPPALAVPPSSRARRSPSDRFPSIPFLVISLPLFLKSVPG